VSVDETLKDLQHCLVMEGVRQSQLREIGWFTFLNDCRTLTDEDVTRRIIDERGFTLFAAFRYLAIDEIGNWDGNRTIVPEFATFVRLHSNKGLSEPELVEWRQILQRRPVDVAELKQWFGRLFPVPKG